MSRTKKKNIKVKDIKEDYFRKYSKMDLDAVAKIQSEKYRSRK